MQSCLYQGSVFHARREPVSHRFRYSVAMAYLDLDEATQLLRESWLASASRWSPVGFRAADHLWGVETSNHDDDPSDAPARLADEVRRHVARETGRSCAGPVRLLTQLRQFGCYFSPLNLFYCFADKSAGAPQAIVAEVSNTPWNERRLYLLHTGNQVAGQGSALRYRHAKDFHVSPFMGLDATYDWRLSIPDEQLRVRIRSTSGAGPPFDAAMSLRRRPWSDRALAATLLRFPVSSLQTLAAIYWQAFRLWQKRCPFHPHPNSIPAAA
ncbi:MAG: DUF1365 domain-containing protein [Pirellula sp.]|nr:DUF1365 domain-containing protein [Pirellula sp.]